MAGIGGKEFFPVKSRLVNCTPWSVLKTSGAQIRSAVRSASRQKPESSAAESALV
jgi:hypothetical protein